MTSFYTDEINTLILISLLKEHGIKKVIASPGTTNISFVGSIQTDPYFEVYSAVDERAAGFMACGLAEESGEAVVLSCTGATASRNYIPGLTEAYYRKLPILAITATQHIGKVGNYVAQVIDRSEHFEDMVKMSVELPTVYSENDKEDTITKVNNVLLELFHHEPGPCHINLCTIYSNGFTVKKLPKYRKIQRIQDEKFPELPKGKMAIFVGAHQEFSEEETKVIDAFCGTNDAIVICDQISNYRGKYRFLANLVNNQQVDLGLKNYELVIYIGYVHGAYIPFKSKQLWRVNPDGKVRDPYRNLTYVFEMQEKDFFIHYSNGETKRELLEKSENITASLLKIIPELPFSNMWIAKETSRLIPDNSVLHLSILNTLRVWNYFETPQSILCYSNSGGYGIDGCLSSFWGSASVNPDREHYMVIGDLSFFYDLNILLNHIPKNMHILLINNGVGTEFKNYSHRAAYFGEAANSYIAAKGHNGFKNLTLVKGLCKEVGVQYLSAKSKDDYLEKRDVWLKRKNGPILLEVFTSDKDESDALYLMNTIVQDKSFEKKIKNSIVWRIVRKIFRG